MPFLSPDSLASLTRLPRFTADEASGRAFNLDQLVRERTAGKGYHPAERVCPVCNHELDVRGRVAIRAGVVLHGGCL